MQGGYTKYRIQVYKKSKSDFQSAFTQNKKKKKKNGRKEKEKKKKKKEQDSYFRIFFKLET
jgi:hypothetical protein